MGLEEHAHAHVWAVSGKAYVALAGRQQQVNALLATLAPAGGCRWRAGDGAQGPRWDDWRWLPLAAPLQPHWRRWRWVRRRLRDPTDLTAYVVLAPQTAALATVVPVAGSRWTSARCCAEAKGAGGLDQDEGRHGTGGYRPLTVAMGA